MPGSNFLNNIYYNIKPAIPRSLQLWLRRKRIAGQMAKAKNVWPVLHSAGKKPDYWKGWPDEKKFAFVATHDVETQKGHDRCIDLMEVEMALGFRSSFNFVPERYTVDPALRQELTKNGFEVCVHGLKHDGKLFKSRDIFKSRALKINQYLKSWNASGFRSPAMLRNLDWMHDLDIQYDMSTFDTDPFEPQSDGVGTVFPFFIKNKKRNGGYIELPYTLPQDFTIFILMKEKNIRIWKEKLSWLAEAGGMVLINTHPDYMNFGKTRKSAEEFPVELYIEFLEYLKATYKGQYWNALPRELSGHCYNTFSNNINYDFSI